MRGHAQKLNQLLCDTENGHEWVSGKAGDFFHVPSNALHAWRSGTGWRPCTGTLSQKASDRRIDCSFERIDQSFGKPIRG
jgi:hypothetical protein